MAEYLKLKKSNCVNCYKCIRHCPVKSIKYSTGQAQIVSDECILCGQCFVVCPQNAKEIRNDVPSAIELLKSGPVIASVAPSFVANYPGATIATMEKALKQLGFTAAEETAVGASIVKTEYENIIHEGKQEVIISTCCHSVNTLVEKYYPEVLPYLATVLSPMQAHCQKIKQELTPAQWTASSPLKSSLTGSSRKGSLSSRERTTWRRAGPGCSPPLAASCAL